MMMGIENNNLSSAMGRYDLEVVRMIMSTGMLILVIVITLLQVAPNFLTGIYMYVGFYGSS